jgi:hypothetical protein
MAEHQFGSIANSEPPKVSDLAKALAGYPQDAPVHVFIFAGGGGPAPDWKLGLSWYEKTGEVELLVGRSL